MNLNELLVKIAENPNDCLLNFHIAHEYEKIDQTAVSLSFYLKAAEYGCEYHSMKEYVYTSLLKMADCLYKQKDRTFSVSNNLLQAVAWWPERVEAYYLLARFYERTNQWQECYTWCMSGEKLQIPIIPLPLDVDVPPDGIGFEFEKAVSSYHLGRLEESKELFLTIVNSPKLPPSLKTACKNNLNKMGVEGFTIPKYNTLEPVVTAYRKFFGTSADVVVDVGSRDGDDANYLAKQLDAKTVIAIEANPELIPDIVNKYPEMIVHSTAVSDYVGTTTFQKVSSEDKSMVGCSSIFAEKVHSEPQFQGLVEIIEVPVTTLITLLPEGTIDVVKVDVEGFTHEVLQGMFFRIEDVKVFHLETDVITTQPNGKSPSFIKDYMDDAGFYLVDRSYEWGSGIEDQVWVNKKLAKFHREVFNVNF